MPHIIRHHHQLIRHSRRPNQQVKIIYQPPFTLQTSLHLPKSPQGSPDRKHFKIPPYKIHLLHLLFFPAAICRTKIKLCQRNLRHKTTLAPYFIQPFFHPASILQQEYANIRIQQISCRLPFHSSTNLRVTPCTRALRSRATSSSAVKPSSFHAPVMPAAQSSFASLSAPIHIQ